MLSQLKTALRMTLILTVLTGFLYPGIVTALASLFFPRQADGSLVAIDGIVVGSELIGQKFTRPEYFQGRPSAAGDGYDGLSSGGSNLGPTSQKLADRVQADLERFRRENPAFQGPVPADLVTASASGLDPHISPASAYAQVERVAKARGVPASRIQQLVEAHIEARQLGFLGEPRVNVLKLNLALDRELYAASQVIAHPLPHGRSSAVDSEPRASASGLEPGAGIHGAVYSALSPG
jgi:K+-transporting ATPase ATPase C chain